MLSSSRNRLIAAFCTAIGSVVMSAYVGGMTIADAARAAYETELTAYARANNALSAVAPDAFAAYDAARRRIEYIEKALTQFEAEADE